MKSSCRLTIFGLAMASSWLALALVSFASGAASLPEITQPRPP